MRFGHCLVYDTFSSMRHHTFSLNMKTSIAVRLMGMYGFSGLRWTSAWKWGVNRHMPSGIGTYTGACCGLGPSGFRVFPCIFGLRVVFRVLEWGWGFRTVVFLTTHLGMTDFPNEGANLEGR